MLARSAWKYVDSQSTMRICQVRGRLTLVVSAASLILLRGSALQWFSFRQLPVNTEMINTRAPNLFESRTHLRSYYYLEQYGA